jgi:predicted dehydrogenase
MLRVQSRDEGQDHFVFVAGYGRDGQYGWRFDRRRAKGVLGDLGPHMIDLARRYCGEIARVSAHLGTYVDRMGPGGGPLDSANDAAVLAVEFRNGAQGIIQVSAVGHAANRVLDLQTRLHGEAGSLEGDFSFANVAVRGARSAEEQFSTLDIPDELFGDADRANPFDVFFKQSVGPRQFIDAILEDTPIETSFYEGWKAQEVIDAALESHRSGRWVALG